MVRELTAGRRFQLASDYAAKKGYCSGYPSFHDARHGRGIVVGGIFLLTTRVAEWRDAPLGPYGARNVDDVPRLFRAAASYAASENYPGAYPNCHWSQHGSEPVFGTIMIRPGTAEWRDVPAEALGSPSVDDVGAMMRAASQYAMNKGFAAGFPTFHHAGEGSSRVYGVVLINPGNADLE